MNYIMAHKNIYLKNYKGLDRYIANDFKRMGLKPVDTAEYIQWLDKNITQRPLFYITNVLVNTVNDLLKDNNLKIKIAENGLQVEKLQSNEG